MSHVHSPESNPNPPLPVTTTVVPYTTVESMMGRSLIRPAVLRRSTSYLDFTRDMGAETPSWSLRCHTSRRDADRRLTPRRAGGHSVHVLALDSQCYPTKDGDRAVQITTVVMSRSQFRAECPYT